MNHLLFATDLSPESEAAIPYVLTAARAWGAAIDVVHASSSPQSLCRMSLESLSGRIRALAADEVPFVRYEMLSGEPASAILDFASTHQADLIVLGLDRRRALYEGPPLSHASEIVRQARCPVLSVRAGPGRH